MSSHKDKLLDEATRLARSLAPSLERLLKRKLPNEANQLVLAWLVELNNPIPSCNVWLHRLMKRLEAGKPFSKRFLDGINRHSREIPCRPLLRPLGNGLTMDLSFRKQNPFSVLGLRTLMIHRLLEDFARCERCTKWFFRTRTSTKWCSRKCRQSKYRSSRKGVSKHKKNHRIYMDWSRNKEAYGVSWQQWKSMSDKERKTRRKRRREHI